MKYNGKEACQGCKKSGITQPRDSKDSLCYVCQSALNLGLQTVREDGIRYMLIFQHFHAYNSVLLNLSIHKILEALHNEHATQTGGVESIKRNSGSNGRYYKIDEKLLPHLRAMFADMESLNREAKKTLDALPGLAKEQVSIERDRIYNEGIKKGRNLLLQLNSGELILSDLESNFRYNQA